MTLTSIDIDKKIIQSNPIMRKVSFRFQVKC